MCVMRVHFIMIILNALKIIVWEVNFLREKLPATFIFQFWEFPHLWWLAIAKKAKDQAKIFARGISFQANICRINRGRSEEHTSELQSLMRISYAVFCLKHTTT